MLGAPITAFTNLRPFTSRKRNVLLTTTTGCFIPWRWKRSASAASAEPTNFSTRGRLAMTPRTPPSQMTLASATRARWRTSSSGDPYVIMPRSVSTRPHANFTRLWVAGTKRPSFM